MKIGIRLSGNNKLSVRRMICAACFSLSILSEHAQTMTSLDSSYFSLSIDELLHVNLRSISFFEREALTVASSICVIERAGWQRRKPLFV